MGQDTFNSFRLLCFWNNGVSCKAVYSDLPDPTAEKCEMLLQGSQDVNSDNNPGLRAQRQSDPVYDAHNELVILATHGVNTSTSPETQSDYKVGILDIWRIGKYVDVEKITHLEAHIICGNSISSHDDEVNPSVVLEGGVVSASVNLRLDKEDFESYQKFQPHIAQQGDAGWVHVTYRAGDVVNRNEGRNEGHNEMFSYSGISAAGGIEYVYNAHFSEDFKLLRLDTMKSSNFRTLAKDDSLMWHTNHIYFGFPWTPEAIPPTYGAQPAHVFTHGTSGNHNLIFIAIRSDCAQLEIAMVPLKKDGAPDRENNKSSKWAGATEAIRRSVSIRSEPKLQDDQDESKNADNKGRNEAEHQKAQDEPELQKDQDEPELQKDQDEPVLQEDQKEPEPQGDQKEPEPHEDRGGKDGISGTDPSAPLYDSWSRDLKAFEVDGYLFIFWCARWKLTGIVGKLDNDGRIPAGWKWRKVNIKLEQIPDGGSWSIEGGISTSHRFTGVIVHKEYCS